ncbi:OmpA family protein [Embleya sp. NPDC008237]|uniref:OmpA family protein n=1 Tax=Embleya sp. NPDC008237 TaxID=3363978 RepID=UPI0036F00B64
MSRDVGAANGQGRTVILVDTSASLRGTSPTTPGRDGARALTDLVARVVADKDIVAVGAFGGSSDIAWIRQGMTTDWAKGIANGTNRNNRRQQALDCLTATITETRESVPRQGGTDVLAALRAGGTGFANAGAGRRLIVLTDGLTTSGCADLRPAGFREDSEIDAVSRVCLERQEITERTLASVRTVLVGLGQPAEGQPTPTAAQSAWLKRLWLRLCTDAHPTPAVEGDCVAPDTPLTNESKAPTASVTPPADPVVRFGQNRRTTYPLSQVALFAPGSPTVLPQARPQLEDIAVRVRSVPGAEVQVHGYVDPRGDPGNNQRLSQDRAEAVKAVLGELGMTNNVTAYGHGVANDCPQPIAEAPNTGSTNAADRELQCRRRVDVVVIE